MTSLGGAQAEPALRQLQSCFEAHREQMVSLNEAIDEARDRGESRLVDELHATVANARDAFQRAQAVARMIRYATRLPNSLREEVATGQLRQPPRLAAAFDANNGLYHGFAIYELRSGDVARGGRFHVYVTDLVNMRSLLPYHTCWRPAVASTLISLLQSKSEAEQPLVVLRALSDDVALEGYYNRIGFTGNRRAFEDAGLKESYRTGDMLYGC